MKKIILSLIFINVFTASYHSQNVAINGSGALPVASAMLDIASTNSGLLIPRMITTDRLAIGTPATGLVVYDTTTNGFWYFDGTVWVQLLNATTGWSLAGNALVGTEFMGSTNAQPVRFFSNNTERMRILGSGQVAVNSTVTFATSTFYSSATGNNSAVDGDANGIGAAIYGQNLGTGQGVFGLSTNATGLGVYGLNTNATGIGVYGFNNAAAGASIGFGGFFRSNQSGGSGIAANIGANSYYAGTAVSAFAVNTVAGGRGVLAACDNATGAGIQGQSAGNGSSFGVLGITTGANIAPIGIFGVNIGIINGTSFLSAGCRKAIYGQSNNLTATYNFGVYGSGGIGTRSGGVIGSNNNGATIFSAGALGYYTGGSNDVGVYGFGLNYTIGFAGGKMSNNINNALTEPNAMVGLGIYGGVMGGWIKGLVYGANLSGERYGAYVHGKTIANDVIAVLNANPNSNERTATYATTAMQVEVTSKGKAKLENGTTTVLFNNQFSSLLSSQEPIIITVSPLGNSQGLYIENITTDGFTVVENNRGTSVVNFNWIAIGVKKGFENPIISPEILANDFEEKINGNSGVMYNDNNPETPTYSIWWDGTKVRFDKPTFEIKKLESTIKPAEAQENNSQNNLEIKELSADTKKVNKE